MTLSSNGYVLSRFYEIFLLVISKWSQPHLEIAESIDMLRVLEYGIEVCMVVTKYQTHAVDTIEDLNKVSELMKESGTERF